MAFSMREFVKRGLLNAVGKQAEYQIIQRATGWLDKGVLEISDLEEIQNALNARSVVGDVTAPYAEVYSPPVGVPDESDSMAAEGDEMSDAAPQSVPEEPEDAAQGDGTISQSVPEESDNMTAAGDETSDAAPQSVPEESEGVTAEDETPEPIPETAPQEPDGGRREIGGAI